MKKFYDAYSFFSHPIRHYFEKMTMEEENVKSLKFTYREDHRALERFNSNLRSMGIDIDTDTNMGYNISQTIKTQIRREHDKKKYIYKYIMYNKIS